MKTKLKMRELFPLAMDVNDYELSHKIIDVAERVLEMTQP